MPKPHLKRLSAYSFVLRGGVGLDPGFCAILGSDEKWRRNGTWSLMRPTVVGFVGSYRDVERTSGGAEIVVRSWVLRVAAQG